MKSSVLCLLLKRRVDSLIIATHMPLDIAQKQAVLELLDVHERIEHMLGVLEGEIDLFQVKNAFAVASRNRWSAASESTTSMSK